MSKVEVPFETALLVRDTCLCLHVQRAARTLARHFDEALRPVGLTNGQYSLMLALNRPRPARMGDVARLLATDRTTLTAALKPLQRRGLVEVLVDPDDKRGRLMVLTEAGRNVLASAVPIWKREHAAVESRLGSSHPDRLRQDLVALSRTATRRSEPDPAYPAESSRTAASRSKR